MPSPATGTWQVFTTDTHASQQAYTGGPHLVSCILVTLAEPAARRKGSSLGHTHKLKGKVALQSADDMVRTMSD
jgi:hypothetical protein